jgi:hypothetical protein
MAEVAVPRQMFQEILSLIARLRAPPWLTTLAPILISFSRRLVSDHGAAVFGIAALGIAHDDRLAPPGRTSNSATGVV